MRLFVKQGEGKVPRPWQRLAGAGAPPPEYTRSGGYGAGAAGGSGEGPPRARPLPAIRPRPCRSAVLHYLAIRSPRAFLTKVRAFQPFTPVFAHDSGESALVPAPHPVFCARFGRKCARSGLRPRVSRAFWAKVCSFRPLTPSFAHDSDENARVGARTAARRERLCRIRARRGFSGTRRARLRQKRAR